MGALRQQCFFATDATTPSMLHVANMSASPEFVHLHAQEPWRFSLPSDCPHANSPRCADFSDELLAHLNRTRSWHEFDAGDGGLLCGGGRTCPRVGGFETFCSMTLPGTGKLNPLPGQGWDDHMTTDSHTRRHGMIGWSPNFDTIWSAWVTIFQVQTLEGWTDIMYEYEDSAGVLRSRVFFPLLVIIGAYFLISVMLAVITDCYARAIDAGRNIKHLDEETVASVMSEFKEIDINLGVDWVLKSLRFYDRTWSSNAWHGHVGGRVYSRSERDMSLGRRVWHPSHGEGEVSCDLARRSVSTNGALGRQATRRQAQTASMIAQEVWPPTRKRWEIASL